MADTETESALALFRKEQEARDAFKKVFAVCVNKGVDDPLCYEVADIVPVDGQLAFGLSARSNSLKDALLFAASADMYTALAMILKDGALTPLSRFLAEKALARAVSGHPFDAFCQQCQDVGEIIKAQGPRSRA